MREGFQPLDCAPGRGHKMDMLCQTPTGFEIVVPELSFARHPMNGTIVITGKQNQLSPHLTPIGWRLHDKTLVEQEAAEFRAWDKATHGAPT